MILLAIPLGFSSEHSLALRAVLHLCQLLFICNRLLAAVALADWLHTILMHYFQLNALIVKFIMYCTHTDSRAHTRCHCRMLLMNYYEPRTHFATLNGTKFVVVCCVYLQIATAKSF